MITLASEVVLLSEENLLILVRRTQQLATMIELATKLQDTDRFRVQLAAAAIAGDIAAALSVSSPAGEPLEDSQ